jgi:hypothetical protein
MQAKVAAKSPNAEQGVEMNLRAPDPRTLTLSAARSLALMALAATHFMAGAQMAAAPPKAAASAASAVLVAPVPKLPAPAPRVLSPAQQMQENAPVDDTRPEGTVAPQIMIPLGQKPAYLINQDKPTPAGKRIDDSAARCEAIADATERAACRDKLPR